MYLSFPDYINDGLEDEHDASLRREVSKFRLNRSYHHDFEGTIDLLRYLEKHPEVRQKLLGDM